MTTTVGRRIPLGRRLSQGLPPTTVPVHPTQLYKLLASASWDGPAEVAATAVDDAIVLGRYFIVAGTLRFVVELIRVNTRVLWGLSVAHLVSFAVIAVGIGMLSVARPEPRALTSRTPS